MGKKSFEQVCHEEKQRAPTGAQSGPTPTAGTAALWEGLPALRTTSSGAHARPRTCPKKAEVTGLQAREQRREQRGPPVTHSRRAHTCFPGRAFQNKPNEPMGLQERGCLGVGCRHRPAPWRRSWSHRPECSSERIRGHDQGLCISFHASFALKGKKNHKQTLGSSQVITRLLKGLGTAGGCLHLTLKNAKKTGRDQRAEAGERRRGVRAACVRGGVGASHCIINRLNFPCV